MEFEYGEEYQNYRKESQSALHKREVSGKEQLSRYEPKEDSREGKAPRETLRMQSAYGTFNFGKRKEKEGEPVLTVSEQRQKDHSVRQDEKRIKMEGAVPVRRFQKKAVTNSHNPRESAVALRMKKEITGERAVRQLQELAEKDGLHTIDRILPFLKDREERERIRDLQQTKQEVNGLGRTEEKELERLRENQIHRRQAREKLVKEMNRALAEKEPAQKENQRGKYEVLKQFLWTEEDREAEESEDEKGPGEDQKEKLR